MINKKGWGFCFVSGMLLAHLYAICVQRLGSMYCVSTFDMESLSGCSGPLEHIHTGRRKCPACVRFGIFCCGIVVRGIINGSVNLPISFHSRSLSLPGTCKYPSLNTSIVLQLLYRRQSDTVTDYLLPSFLPSSMASIIAYLFYYEYFRPYVRYHRNHHPEATSRRKLNSCELGQVDGQVDRPLE